MALDINETKFLLHARRLGVSFAATATIGRQALHISANHLMTCLRSFGFDLTDAEIDNVLTDADGYAEPLFEMLGAKNAVSFDASDYENATFVHDFNQPIPKEHIGRFSCVLDGGTLEHIFNFPIAIKNCMQMLEVGGHFLGIAPTNNYSGHGFYQFSAELFFRVFVPVNGFEIVKVYIVEEAAKRHWYEVADPDKVKQRVMLINDDPSLLIVIAKKIADADVFAVSPQQSDYLAMWSAPNGKGTIAQRHSVGRFSGFLNRIRKAAGRPLGMLNWRRDHFRRIDDNEL